MSLHDDVQKIETPSDLADFVERLTLDFESNPAGWENADLPSYLEALAAWTQDMPGYFENRGEDMAGLPPWRVLGLMLLAARSYE